MTLISPCFIPDEKHIDDLIDKNTCLSAVVKKNQPYEIKLLVVSNHMFFNSAIQKKATNTEKIDKNGAAVKSFIKI